MSFRRHSKSEWNAWEAWKQANGKLLDRCGLPPGVLRSRRDWDYLMRHGYWCEGAYGAYINKIDFDLCELTPSQVEAFRALLTITLSDEEKQRGSAGWHFVCPPGA